MHSNDIATIQSPASRRTLSYIPSPLSGIPSQVNTHPRRIASPDNITR